MRIDYSYKHLFVILAVWMLRILVGSVFIISGLTKLIDLWGVVFKIEDYLAAWNWDVPRTLVLVGGLLLSIFEFTTGVLMTTGCYRKLVAWLMLLCMAFMLPFTIYIWIASPVNDCGCFGEFLIISNLSTMLKNIVLVVMLIALLKYNERVGAVFHKSIQWSVMVVGVIYALIIGLIGYNIQPVEDFRPFPPGKPILKISDDNYTDTQFIYAKDGHKETFSIDNLPDESDGWTYVDRIEGDNNVSENIIIYDPDSGEDVSEDVLLNRDSLLILIIPEPARADLSYTYTINELSELLADKEVDTVGLLATGSAGIERWKDNSMASYECYSADDTQLKELARGLMSFIWIVNDTIKWKRTVSSINIEDINAVANDERSVSSLGFDGHKFFRNLSGMYIAILLLILLIQESGFTIKNQLHRWKNLCKFAK